MSFQRSEHDPGAKVLCCDLCLHVQLLTEEATRSIRVDDEVIKAQIWEAAGQEPGEVLNHTTTHYLPFHS